MKMLQRSHPKEISDGMKAFWAKRKKSGWKPKPKRTAEYYRLRRLKK